VVFTPKSMLRHPDASSTIEDLTQPRFLPVVPDREVTDAKRILIASGRVGHDLKAERRKRKDSNTAIWTSCTRCRVRKYPQHLPRIPTRAKWCGCRKSRATWARSFM
jgi:2-oxoglutarate dehydrogenase complex dehydrogenase (E1) component-like enzyme